MPTITTQDGTQIYYKDWGEGQPVVFSHGWPLSADDWDGQMLFFGQRGYRVIAHDRRGHGRSEPKWPCLMVCCARLARRGRGKKDGLRSIGGGGFWVRKALYSLYYRGEL